MQSICFCCLKKNLIPLHDDGEARCHCEVHKCFIVLWKDERSETTIQTPHKEAYFILLARGCHLAKRIALQANNASYCEYKLHTGLRESQMIH